MIIFVIQSFDELGILTRSEPFSGYQVEKRRRLRQDLVGHVPSFCVSLSDVPLTSVAAKLLPWCRYLKWSLYLSFGCRA